jgi:N-acetylglucosamine-6-phosphate deacetylase
VIRAFIADRLFDGFDFRKHHAVLVEDGVVLDLVEPGGVPDEAERHMLPAGHMIAPGYIDLQVNGGGGVLLNDDPSAVAMASIAAAHRALGTAAILPTLISGSPAQVERALSAAVPPIPGVIGLHVEGPHLAPSRRGIHPESAIRPLTDPDLDQLCAFPDRLLVTLAPERVAPSAIARLTERGVIVFAGHTEADAQTMRRALDAGLRGITHLFNAMPGPTARAPGPAGTALDDPRCMAGIILDRLHVDPAMVRLAWRCMGPDRLFLVSDAMPTVGATTTSFRLGDTEIRLADGRLTGPDGTLGGAHLCLAEAVRHAIAIGIPAGDALRMATSTPARAIGTDHGRIAPGVQANFIVLDSDFRMSEQARGLCPLDSGVMRSMPSA